MSGGALGESRKVVWGVSALLAAASLVVGLVPLKVVGAVLALVFAYFFYGGVMKASEGDPEMIRIANAVREGAYAYLSRQRRVVSLVFVGLL